ncbi:MAG: ParB N-terminal domain-containing protein [bacterium]
MEAQMVKIEKLSLNDGQIEDVPANPRDITGENYRLLKDSILKDPEMMNLREVIAYDNDGELVVIAGNMRLMALRELGYKEVPVKILQKETPAQKLRAYAIKDNISYGEFDDLKLDDWDSEELEEWGLPRDKPDSEKDEQEIAEEYDNTNAKYPLIPIFDEKYQAVVIVCETETELARMKTKFGLNKKHQSYKNSYLGETQVVDSKDIE